MSLDPEPEPVPMGKEPETAVAEPILRGCNLSHPQLATLCKRSKKQKKSSPPPAPQTKPSKKLQCSDTGVTQQTKTTLTEVSQAEPPA